MRIEQWFLTFKKILKRFFSFENEKNIKSKPRNRGQEQKNKK